MAAILIRTSTHYLDSRVSFSRRYKEEEMKDSEHKNLEKNNSLATPKIEEPRGRRPAGVELPCCSGTSPCKHWVYDGLNDKWTNTLSGEEKEEQL